jgi:hypothetical protein
MSHLTTLTPSRFLPSDQSDDFAELKFKLIQVLDRQAGHCEALLNDGVFEGMVRLWLRCEDDALSLPADRFYWQHKTGAWIITLRVDQHILPICETYPSIEVGHAEDIPNALETLKRAYSATIRMRGARQSTDISQVTLCCEALTRFCGRFKR